MRLRSITPRGCCSAETQSHKDTKTQRKTGTYNRLPGFLCVFVSLCFCVSNFGTGSLKSAFLLFLRSQEGFRSKRNLPQPDAGGIIDGIANGGCDERDRNFA